MRWTRIAPETRVREADGQVVWSRRLDAGVKFLGSKLLRATEAKKPDLRGERV